VNAVVIVRVPWLERGNNLLMPEHQPGPIQSPYNNERDNQRLFPANWKLIIKF
jgi:hypothetical protein